MLHNSQQSTDVANTQRARTAFQRSMSGAFQPATALPRREHRAGIYMLYRIVNRIASPVRPDPGGSSRSAARVRRRGGEAREGGGAVLVGDTRWGLSRFSL